ncbi:response regulator receiver modulated PilZ sensor protein [Anaeromyxobacter dehalogenans 2CP-1]|uniref:Response regulator receiver modulated PilZ sensor protein n=1 Tax=Anaeromyxobacter dehalogenans (strain ATCC BAA-258 / DSM 21875 / 2CP-1) TaxID=455488 RepID=B8J7M9_ANAD2|nr:response regulator [Anaeromyxobacter dehalogenans]ACL67209.1 response regulator receiver modulated PilZ sensor protein [Anaeromyxobacter dehalogenans 2CP-1]
MDERRAHPRFPLILAVQYLGAENVLDYTENLSAGGLFIRTERSFDEGERVTLVLSFPQLLEPVELQIEVVRRRDGSDGSPAGVAVRVPDDRPEDRARLADVARRVAGVRHPDPSFRILLVEDNALVATMYAAALRRLSETEHVPGLGIEVASDGAAAFDRLLRAPAVDVVVTDVFMPIVSGITLVERIRAEPTLAHLPVVVITAGGEQERERLSGLGVSLFLRKPVSYQDLSGAVRSLLDGRAAHLQAAPPREEARREALTADAEVGTDRADAKPASRR